MSNTQEDFNESLTQILTSFETLLKDLEGIDKKDKQATIEAMAGHTVREIQIIVNTMHKPGMPMHLDDVKLEETRRRFFDFIGNSSKQHA